MGYTTDFEGRISISPPLNRQEIAFLTKLSGTRRMHRHSGPYTVDGEGPFGQAHTDDVVAFNDPPPEQPGLWCKWIPTGDGTALEWSGAEKFYDSVEWMAYLIDTFLRAGATVQRELAEPIPNRTYPREFRRFTFDHTLDGEIHAQGEDPDDRWTLVVRANEVTERSDSPDPPGR